MNDGGVDDGVWLSVSQVARARGISKQAVSKRLKALAGRVATRADGSNLLVNIAEFDRVTGADTDPAQGLRNRHLEQRADSSAPSSIGSAGGAPQRTEGLAAKIYSQQRARRESYDAERARLDLEERIGKLLPVADVEQAMVRCAEVLVRIIDQLPAMTDDPTLRPILKDKARELRESLAREMRLLKSVDNQADETDQVSE